MKNHKQNIKRCFNKAAATYDQYSHIQKLAGEVLMSIVVRHSREIGNPINVIDLGCGTGLISEQLFNTCKPQNIYAIDIAEKLLFIAQERLKKYTNKVVLYDFDEFNFNPKSFDLVFSNMSLQWSLNIRKTLMHIYKNMHRDGIIIFSLPIKGTFVELNQNKNKFHHVKSILKFLTDAKFTKIQQFSKKTTLHFDSLFSALKSIKAVGANHIFHSRSYRFSRKTLHEKFSLTYQIGFFMAVKQ